MESEAQTPAGARLERAIRSLETALADRRQTDAEAGATAIDASAAHEDLVRRHDALKSAVAASVGDIDALLRESGQTAGDRTDA